MGQKVKIQNALKHTRTKNTKKQNTKNVLTQNIKFRDSAPRGDPKEPTQIKIKY